VPCFFFASVFKSAVKAKGCLNRLYLMGTRKRKVGASRRCDEERIIMTTGTPEYDAVVSSLQKLSSLLLHLASCQ
jgi:hypothetical protein